MNEIAVDKRTKTGDRTKLCATLILIDLRKE